MAGSSLVEDATYADPEKESMGDALEHTASTTAPNTGNDGIANKYGEAGEADPNIVDWDGPDDPQNPMNWPDSKKWLNVAVLSILTIITSVYPMQLFQKIY